MIVATQPPVHVKALGSLSGFQADAEALLVRVDGVRNVVRNLQAENFLGHAAKQTLAQLSTSIGTLYTNVTSFADRATDAPSAADLSQLHSFSAQLEQLISITHEVESTVRRNAILVGVGAATLVATGAYFAWKKG